MKQKSFYSLLLAGVITFSASMVSGCMEDLSVEMTSELITLDIRDSVATRASVSSKQDYDSKSVRGAVLTSKTGKSLYLGVTESVWPIQAGTAHTRGAKVNTAGVNTFGVSASI